MIVHRLPCVRSLLALGARFWLPWSLYPRSRKFGFDRGQPIDRYYMEKFLEAHRAAIHGHVLEIADQEYTLKFGGSKVTQGDILHVDSSHPRATIIGDLNTGAGLPDATFDCLILTQVLPFVSDVLAVLRNVRRTLATNGCAIITVPGISQISRYDEVRWGDFWRFTPRGLRYQLDQIFPSHCTEIQAFGNVLAATCFLQGLASHEVRRSSLDFHDEDYPVLIAAKVFRD